MPKAQCPTVLRGDIASGSESVLREAEARDQPYLTKLRLTKHGTALIKTVFRSNEWEEAGHGWDGGTDRLMLSGWSRARRVVVLRRTRMGDMLLTGKDDDQGLFAFMESDVPTKREYAVLGTSTPYEILALAQLYRDRADAENTVDELQNPWGWGGFTTQDLARCRLMSAPGGLGGQLVDAVRAARPAAQALRGDLQPAAVAAWRRHAHAPCRTNAPDHHQPARQALQAVLTTLAGVLRALKATAEPWTDADRLRAILARAFATFMRATAGPPALPTAETPATGHVDCRF